MSRRWRVWALSTVLAYSRHSIVRPVLVMDQAAWAEAHVAAFDFYNGPRRIVPDNLRAGIIRPDAYDPKVNRSYGELGTHYGVLLDPARAFHQKINRGSKPFMPI
jgi:transposase